MATVNIASSDNITGIRLKEQASSPTTPPSGYAQLYVNTTPAVQFEDDAGTVRTLSDTTHTHPTLTLTEQAAAPATPASGFAELYVDTTPALKFKNDGGTVVTLSDTTHTHAASAITSGTLDVARIPSLPASQITSGTLDNARVNWAAPSAIGGTTPAAGTFSEVVVRGAAATYRLVQFRTSTTDRWILVCDNTAESGSNVGSNFQINRYADAGTFAGSVLSLVRSTGNATFSNDLAVGGALSKGSGSFLIDHPLDTMPDYTLRHEFVEAPRADLIYRGVAEFANNQTEVTMSIDASSRMTAGTFVALTQNPVIHVSNNDTWELVRGRVVGGDVVIERKDGRGKLTVDWLVIAERADDFIKTVDYTDEDGRVIPEQRKEALDEDAVMQTIEAFDDDMPEEEVRTRVAELVRGKGNNKMRGVLKDNRSRAKVDELVKRKRKKGKRNEQ